LQQAAVSDYLQVHIPFAHIDPMAKNTPQLQTSLREQTLHLLQNRNVQLTLKKIAEDTGIKESWLSMFQLGKIEKPSADFIQTLYEYLAKEKLLAT
jgi:hypothetical protein